MTDRHVEPAFGPLEDRAKAMDGRDPLDRISLRDHIVSVEIGAFQSERDAVQRLAFNVVVEVEPSDGAATDDVDKILSYDTITNAIAFELAAERLNLLETLAERIATRLLSEPQSARVFVRIEKLDRGPGALGVEIVRSRRIAPQLAISQTPAQRPVVVNLDETAIEAPNLNHWLDQFQALGCAVIFVIRTKASMRRANTAVAQERIDLLEMEQAAWQLAARDDRMTVVETRTELAHAVQNGLLVAWAPSKIVLDAVEKPPFEIANIAPLVEWFAREQDARAVLSIGGSTGQDIETEDLDLGAVGDA